MKFQANMNDTVEVVLTTKGAEMYNERWKFFGRPVKYEGDVIRTQLWTLFQIFGEHIHLGMGEVPFKDCKINFV